MGGMIEVENLGKRYRLGGQDKSYAYFREDLVRLLRAPFGKSGRRATDEFWALRDVSFSVESGAVVGLIGANGAGKSTLLKILSRITRPSEGRVRLHGRVGSLLEVGTGFHPELTGRENIYLSGAILGMDRGEVCRKFDEIVDFAEVHKFIDTPVKHYSSGMYVRLGFAIAAHLEPEILLVDEVLAVGDAAFQQKCLGKMGEVSRGGRTIVFVSHNMAAVKKLCSRCILIAEGTLAAEGDASLVIDTYLKSSTPQSDTARLRREIAALPADPSFRLFDVVVRQAGSANPASIFNGDPVHVDISYEVLKPEVGLRVYADLYDDDRNLLVRSFFDEDASAIRTIEPGTYRARLVLPGDFLAPRRYELRVYGTIFNQRCLTPGGVGTVLDVRSSGHFNAAYSLDPVRSKLQPRFAWEVKRDEP